MEAFLVDEPVDGALITGRRLSYLTTNHQLMAAFKVIYQNLKAEGLLVFDAIDAKALFATIIQDSSATIQADTSSGTIRRESRNTPLLTSGWNWRWDTHYQISTNGNDFISLGNDQTELRAFTLDEIELLLSLTGFSLIEIVHKPVYSWQSPYYMARRVSKA